ncbi:MAG: HAMP domain-containing histidine kinase [Eubacterium sp.]|nr:HAMP domain-containing histidine kinase [Eubacterium sp.]
MSVVCACPAWFFAAGTAVIVTAAAGVFWRRYFEAKEKALLNRLEQMIWRAKQGRFQVTELSEYEVSVLENEFKRFLDDQQILAEDREKQKNLVQELISDIAHQTLTPVSNLKIYAELLKEALSEADPVNVLLVDTMAEQTGQLEFLIQSLVKLSRMEQGMIQVHPVPAPLEGLLNTLQRDYVQQAAAKGIRLDVEHTGLEAVFDRKWTAEALGNLVDNAIKYTKKGGLVAVRVKSYSFFACIEVCDTGMGIAEEEIPKIFGRFYRSMAAEDCPGAGIGLFLAREMIQAQKGYIKAASRVGEGSVFSVFLPNVSKL